MAKTPKSFLTENQRSRFERNMISLFLSAFENAGNVQIHITYTGNPYVGNGGIIEFTAHGEKFPRTYLVHEPHQKNKALKIAEKIRDSVSTKLEARLRQKNINIVE